MQFSKSKQRALPNLLGGEQSRQVFVSAGRHDFALALQVGLDDAQLADAERLVQTDEAELSILKVQ